jgi:hypothetical protein
MPFSRFRIEFSPHVRAESRPVPGRVQERKSAKYKHTNRNWAGRTTFVPLLCTRLSEIRASRVHL